MKKPTPRIVVDGVWKRFRRGQVHDSLRDLLPSLARKVLRRPTSGVSGAAARDFWALQDVSFSVEPGQVFGIIGGNGAGKSTILKLLNNIMDPTLGSVSVTGRVGALIELSAGFHPDLTGRQNIFLQGAIMGMRKAETARKFDDIVEFSGISDFIDTPVKRYSSGMNARLGFSIAAHLEPDVLLIDEVLAVGDHTFQTKAFSRIQAIASGGAPVVLVSHQLERVATLCTQVMLLDKGIVQSVGDAMSSINAYLGGTRITSSGDRHDPSGIVFSAIRAADGMATFTGATIAIHVSGTAEKRLAEPDWELAFKVYESKSGGMVYSVLGSAHGIALPPPGRFDYELSLQMNVRPGLYAVEICLWDRVGRVDVITGPRVEIEVLERLPFGGRYQLNSQWIATPTPSGAPGLEQ